MARKNAKAQDGLTIACKLPTGLHIKLPHHKIDIKLHGAHSAYEVAGHGMTRGVDAQQWAIVEKAFAEAAWLKNGFVFSATTPDSAADEAEDRVGEKSGFEPIDPDKLPKGIENGEVPQ